LNNPATQVKESDLAILEIIASSKSVSQRELAQKSGFSLGMVNLVLRRLAKTGYIKVANLDRRKMSYIVTPAGIAQKSRRSYDYFLRTIRVYEQYRKHLCRILDEQIAKGKNKFLIYGEGEIADLLRVLLSSKGASIKYRSIKGPGPVKASPDEIVLNCYMDHEKTVQGISIMEMVLNTNNGDTAIESSTIPINIARKGES
jgi:DNA-binding MarR family transcriptional regulator